MNIVALHAYLNVFFLLLMTFSNSVVSPAEIPLGSCLCLSVTQSPADLFLLPGDSLNITCSHYDQKYDKIYWYQQNNLQRLDLIGFLNFKKPEAEKMGFKTLGDAEKEGYLTAQSVTTDYSASYFCAVSATVLYAH